MDFNLQSRADYETWDVSKSAVTGKNGIVVAQEIEAANIGKQVLLEGGNAVDAAVATALALCVTEPWMSGLGGGGFMIVYLAKQNMVKVVDFGMISPLQLQVSDYPLSGEAGGDLFGWPAVENDTNIHGARSIAVPGSVAGYSLAIDQFGRRSWSELLDPIIKLAERGHRKTWWTTLNVVAEAQVLKQYNDSAKVWLPNETVPSVPQDLNDDFLKLGKLASTFQLLSDNGAEYFYKGELAKDIVDDVRASGGRLSIEDFQNYAATIKDPLIAMYDGLSFNLEPNYSAGPTFADALSRLPDFEYTKLEAEKHFAIAEALIEAYQHRLNTMGHAGDFGDRSCTTHINTLDADGNMVAMTTTLLSRFGSRFISPSTGILMNNGINWFDPRQGRPNSVAPAKKPLSNMCPLIAFKNGQPFLSLGASGGRKILPSVFQIALYIKKFSMTLQSALAYPRTDVSTLDKIIYDPRFTDQTVKELGKLAPLKMWEPTAFPSAYAVPSGIHIADGVASGAVHPFSPLSAAVAC
ncbi:MAG: gamma-glutamyltransferase [Pseudomonadota bacterium]|nr:gamma-glutamyltransferase [Pseudomonadota bacterium]MEE3008468.1 gamma-glutamyltransferase [Pseudomonadota bacterium]